MVPLLQVMSRGSPMSLEDSGRIIPLFYLFSSLFSHSLISIHDNEFFGDLTEGEGLQEPGHRSGPQLRPAVLTG